MAASDREAYEKLKRMPMETRESCTRFRVSVCEMFYSVFVWFSV